MDNHVNNFSSTDSNNHNSTTKLCSNNSSLKCNNNYLSKLNDMSQFILYEKIGQGTFGSVRIATHILTSEQIAIKILLKSKIKTTSDINRIEREISILKSLMHPNIVQLYSVITTSHSINLIQEYIQGKNFSDYLSSKGKLNEKDACIYFKQLVSAVEYIHNNNISHRDLKPDNIIITKYNELKIIDFGLSNYYSNKNNLLETPCGSPYYAAPEMLQGNFYSGTCIDIWSCGVILYLMLCGSLPFEADSHPELYKKIISGKFTLPSFLSMPAKDLIRKILVTLPKKRYKISQIKKHEWIKLNCNNEKEKYYEGIDLKNVIIPIDEGIVKDMEQIGFDKKEIRNSLLMNYRDNISMCYYLLVKQKIRKGDVSVSNLKSDLYFEYCKDIRNQLSYYNNDINKVIELRNISQEKQVKKENVKQTYIHKRNRSAMDIMSQTNIDIKKNNHSPNKTNVNQQNDAMSKKNKHSLSTEKKPTHKVKLSESLHKYKKSTVTNNKNDIKIIPKSVLYCNKEKTKKSNIDNNPTLTLENTPQSKPILYRHYFNSNNTLNTNNIKTKHKIIKCTPFNAHKILSQLNSAKSRNSDCINSSVITHSNIIIQPFSFKKDSLTYGEQQTNTISNNRNATSQEKTNIMKLNKFGIRSSSATYKQTMTEHNTYSIKKEFQNKYTHTLSNKTNTCNKNNHFNKQNSSIINKKRNNLSQIMTHN